MGKSISKSVICCSSPHRDAACLPSKSTRVFRSTYHLLTLPHQLEPLLPIFSMDLGCKSTNAGRGHPQNGAARLWVCPRARVDTNGIFVVRSSKEGRVSCSQLAQPLSRSGRQRCPAGVSIAVAPAVSCNEISWFSLTACRDRGTVLVYTTDSPKESVSTNLRCSSAQQHATHWRPRGPARITVPVRSGAGGARRLHIERGKATSLWRVITGTRLSIDAAYLSKTAGKVGMFVTSHDALGAEEDHTPIEPEQPEKADELRVFRDSSQVASVDDRPDAWTKGFELQVKTSDGDWLEDHCSRDLLGDESRVFGAEELSQCVCAGPVLVWVVYRARSDDWPKARSVVFTALHRTVPRIKHLRRHSITTAHRHSTRQLHGLGWSVPDGLMWWWRGGVVLLLPKVLY